MQTSVAVIKVYDLFDIIIVSNFLYPVVGGYTSLREKFVHCTYYMYLAISIVVQEFFRQTRFIKTMEFNRDDIIY